MISLLCIYLAVVFIVVVVLPCWALVCLGVGLDCGLFVGVVLIVVLFNSVGVPLLCYVVFCFAGLLLCGFALL